jgi:hypothetical protein
LVSFAAGLGEFRFDNQSSATKDSVANGPDATAMQGTAAADSTSGDPVIQPFQPLKSRAIVLPGDDH